MYEIFHYLTVDGRDPFQEWLESLRDRQAKARVAVRLNRMAAGNLGDHKPVGGGVWELRIDAAPGLPRVLLTDWPATGAVVGRWR